MPGGQAERLEDLAMLLDVRVRRRQLRGATEIRLRRHEGPWATFVIQGDLAASTLGQLVAALLDEAAEVRAAATFERWRATTDAEEAGRRAWRRAEKNTRLLEQVLGADAERFARADRSSIGG